MNIDQRQSFMKLVVLLWASRFAFSGEYLCFGQELQVDVGGYSLQARVCGQGHPAVVFLNGGSATMDYWNGIVEGLSERTTVITYERGGHQNSGIGQLPRHGKTIAFELKKLMDALHVVQPPVVVAHSAGCMYARIFASEYPESVSGMILLDPGDRDVLDAFGETHLSGQAQVEWSQYWEKLWTRLAKRPDGFGNEVQMKETTLEQMLGSNLPASLKLVVVSSSDRNRPHGYLRNYGEEVIQQFYNYAEAYHQSLAQSVTNGIHVRVPDARHAIHVDRPDLVISLIHDMLDTVSGETKRP